MKKLTAILLALLISVSGCTVADDTPKFDESLSAKYKANSAYGSARHIHGRTVIVSIYSDDPTNRWDPLSEVDKDTIEQTLYYLGIATDWISEQASRYGADAEFIYDWKENEDLRYNTTFTTELEKDDATYTSTVYPQQKRFLRNNVDTDALLKKYDADNIIYMFFINSDFSNQANPVTSPKAYLYGDDYYTDHINLCVRFDDYYVTAPSSYAHEILHCFGAYDLYYENQVITEEYVMHCAESGTYDIMYYVTSGSKIYSEFTELDAYYIGLTDYSQEVEEWDLGPSDFQQ